MLRFGVGREFQFESESKVPVGSSFKPRKRKRRIPMDAAIEDRLIELSGGSLCADEEYSTTNVKYGVRQTHNCSVGSNRDAYVL